MGPAVTRAQPPLSIATRIEDWASQGQPKRKPEIPVVFENPDATREKRRGSNVSQDEALARYSVSREVPCSFLKWETVLGSLDATPKVP